MQPAKIDPEKLRELIEQQGLQQWKAAEILGVSLSWVERNCKRHGLKTARTGPRRGPEHLNWKGGRILNGGYWYVWNPEHPNTTKRGYVAEHRLLISAVLGRPLLRQEVVHHIDGNRQNNDLTNLMLFPSNAAHLKAELTGRIPKWTERGRELIAKGVERAASLRRLRRGG